MSVAHQTPAFTNVISQGERGADRKKVVSNEVGYRCSRNHDTDMQITAVWRAQIETEPLAGEEEVYILGQSSNQDAGLHGITCLSRNPQLTLPVGARPIPG